MLDKFFKGLSVDESVKEQIQSELIMDNVIGLMSINGGSGASTIAANTAHILSKYNLVEGKSDTLTDLVICVVDMNVFNPVQYQLLSVEGQEKGKGLLDALISGPGHVPENLIRVSNTLSLLSASPFDDIYEYYDTTSESISQVIDYLKDHFDIVIIDIPNNPPSPFCYETLKWCNKVFAIWNEHVTIYQHTKRLIDFFNSIKIRNKITHVIFNKKTRTPLTADRIDELVKKLGLKLLTIIPYSQDLVNDSLNGTLYIEQGILKRDIKKSYLKVCSEITQIRLSNIVGGKPSNENVDD